MVWWRATNLLGHAHNVAFRYPAFATSVRPATYLCSLIIRNFAPLNQLISLRMSTEMTCAAPQRNSTSHPSNLCAGDLPPFVSVFRRRTCRLSLTRPSARRTRNQKWFLSLSANKSSHSGNFPGSSLLAREPPALNLISKLENVSYSLATLHKMHNFDNLRVQ